MAKTKTSKKKKPVIPHPPESEALKYLYVFTGDAFKALKDDISLKYIHQLMESIEASNTTLSFINNLNKFSLNALNDYDLNNLNEKDVKEIQTKISGIIENQKTIGGFVKDAPTWLMRLKELEQRFLADVKEAMELKGGTYKGYREDPESVYDLGEPEMVTKKRF